MIRIDEIVYIGYIRRPHGKQGELACYTENTLWASNDATFLIIDRDSLFVPFRVSDWREKSEDTLIMQLDGIESEPQAAALTGAKVYMLRTDIQSEAEKLLTWQDLVGYQVADKEQCLLGIIEHIDESTINTLATLQDERMIPLHEDFIIEIDTKQRILHIKLPFAL